MSLTAEGLELDSYDDLTVDMCADWVDRTGVVEDAVLPDAPDGILIRIVAERISAVNDLVQVVLGALDRDTATGDALVSVAALTGTIQESPTPSTVDLLLAGTALTAIAEGSQASSPTTETLWETVEDVTLAAATAWTITTGYAVRDVVTNSAKVYRCITAGTSAGAGGPTTEAADITDGTVHWAYVADGTGVATVEARATETGPLVGLAYSITEIETPVSGWEAVINLNDADPGTDLELDAALRVRAADELEAQGVSTADAVRAELLRVTGVESITVLVNDTDATDVNGVPPHSFEALVQGGEDQDLWDQLLASKPDGIRAYGTEEGTADDSEGTAVPVAFTRVEQVPIYVEVTVEVDASLFPSDGSTQVKAALAAFGAAFVSGRNVRARALGAAAVSRLDATGNELGVAGVLNATLTKISIAPAPTVETTIAISLRQRATFDTGDIAVVVSEVTP